MNCLVMMKLILYDLAYSIFDMVNTNDYPTIAKRPLNSRMKKGSYKLRSWEEALEHYLKKELNYND